MVTVQVTVFVPYKRKPAEKMKLHSGRWIKIDIHINLKTGIKCNRQKNGNVLYDGDCAKYKDITETAVPG